jgi:hypothetical protein
MIDYEYYEEVEKKKIGIDPNDPSCFDQMKGKGVDPNQIMMQAQQQVEQMMAQIGKGKGMDPGMMGIVKL